MSSKDNSPRNVTHNILLSFSYLVIDFGVVFCRARGYPYPWVIGMTTVDLTPYPEGTTVHTIPNPVDCGHSSHSPYECSQHGFDNVTHKRDAVINCSRT